MRRMMAEFNGDDGATGGKMSWAGPAAAGAAAGGAGVAAYGWAQTVSKRALVGEVGAIVNTGMSVLQGNSAVNLTNTAMAGINSVAGATYTVDIPAIKASIQNLALAVQANTPQGYLGISTVTPPLLTPSSAIPPAASNTGAIIAVGLVIGAVLLLK